MKKNIFAVCSALILALVLVAQSYAQEPVPPRTTVAVDRSQEVLGAIKKLDGRLGGLATAKSVKDLETKVASIETNVAARIQADRTVTDGVLSAISNEVIATKGIAIEARDYSKKASDGVTSLSDQIGRSSSLIYAFVWLGIVVSLAVGVVVVLITIDLKKKAATPATPATPTATATATAAPATSASP